MPDYIVIFDQSPLASSDAAVGGEHIENTSVYAEAQAAKVAYVTAENPEEAEKVVYAAYNGSRNFPVVLTADAVQKVERDVVPVDEPEASEEPNAEPTGDPEHQLDVDSDETDTTAPTPDSDKTVKPVAVFAPGETEPEQSESVSVTE